jgi:hypothetical protein
LIVSAGYFSGLNVATASASISKQEDPMSTSISSLFSSATKNTAFAAATKSLTKNTDKSADDKTSADSFRDHLKMTPAQKMRASLLGSQGVSETQLKTMSPQDRQAIEDKITKQVKEAATTHMQTQGVGGFFTDIKA